MQLSTFTDFGLRILMYLSHQERGTSVTIREIAHVFGISQNHLVKVVHYMAQNDLVLSTRGRNGGIALSKVIGAYRLGDTVQVLERRMQLIDCGKPPCKLQGQCGLKPILEISLTAFYEQLNQYSLKDALISSTREMIIAWHTQSEVFA